MVSPTGGLGPGAAALALLTFALWGGNNLAVKVSLGAIPPLAAAGLRFVLGLAFFAALARLQRVSLRPEPGEWRRLLPLSLLFALQIALLNIGTGLTSAVRSTVFLSAHPLFVALFDALLVPGERLRPAKLAGLVMAFVGVGVAFAEGFAAAGASLLGDGLMVLSAVLLGLRLVVLKQIIRTVPQLRALSWQVGLSLPLLAAGSLLFERAGWGVIGPPHIAAMLYQGVVVAGFCFCVNAWLYQHYRAGDVAAYTFTVPLWGVLFCHLILGDAVTTSVGLGVALVAGGIAVASRVPSR